MRAVYTLAIRLYDWLIALAAARHPKARLRQRGLRTSAAPLSDRPIWFHCASLGEFEQGRPLIERCRAEYPQHPILLSFFSPSGYEVRKNYASADRVVYLPADLPKRVAAFLDYWQPRAAVFIKYEVWQNFYRGMGDRNIPLFLVSAIFRRDQIYFKWYGGWFRDGLREAHTIFTQDEASAELLRAQDPNSVEVAGDTRFDRVVAVAESADPIPAVESFIGGRTAVVAGSTWPEDEALIAAYRKRHGSDDIAWIIAPHEWSVARRRRIEDLFGSGVVYHTSLDSAEVTAKGDVLVIDVVGLLSSLYRYGTVNYVGGGFGAGIHNTLEPAVYGRPVMFGPRYEKFKEARDLIAEGGAYSVADGSGFDRVLGQLLADESMRHRSGTAAKAYVHRNTGATDRIMKALEPHL